MATKKKMLQAAAGNAGAAGLDITEVFSTYLYTGTGSAQTITNGLDLSGEGGMVWTKSRSNAANHVIVDTAQGAYACLSPNLTSQKRGANTVTAFSSSGYTVANDTSDAVFQNTTGVNGQDYASWTFRKAPKFFDVVKISITRDGSNNLTSNNSNATVTGGVVYVNHNLGSVPGLWIQKSTDYAANWYVRSTAFTGTLNLDTTDPKSGSVTHTATSTQAMLDDYGTGTFGVGTHEYIIYLFANNDGDGEFGPDADQDIIKCGVFTPNTSGEITVDLGFEPQFLIYKNTQSADPWIMFDTMRGWGSSVQDWASLQANATSAEVGRSSLQVTSTGFTTGGTGSLANKAYIYIAIRRGPLAQPESGTEVFGLNEYTGNNTAGRLITSSGTGLVDAAFINSSGSGSRMASRLTGIPYLTRNDTSAEINSNTRFENFDDMNGFFVGSNSQVNSSSFTYLAAMWTRAPGFFDAVAYTGDATASPNSRNINHNLGVAPEMMWIKCRSFGENWAVYHSGIGATKYMNLNTNGGAAISANWWRNTAPTDTVFTIGHQDDVNLNGGTHIAYLFATLPGISKVGSYTGNGTSQTINCGFTSGARYVLVKRTNTTGDWVEFNSEYGIVAGNEKAWRVNAGGDTGTSLDLIDPDSTGFIINQEASYNLNVNNSNYIFYAIA